MGRQIVGIDEAGRGPVAGPVAVGLVSIPLRYHANLKKIFPEMIGKDSKKLSEKKREEIFGRLKELQKEGTLRMRVSMVGAGVIDKKGISWAIRAALSRNLQKVPFMPLQSRILLDGGLRAPDEYTQQETIVKGDEKEIIIGLASVVAKVSRDRYMRRIAKKYSQYGFESHKGYGTKHHMNAIRRDGLCPQHRRSFLSSLQ